MSKDFEPGEFEKKLKEYADKAKPSLEKRKKSPGAFSELYRQILGNNPDPKFSNGVDRRMCQAMAFGRILGEKFQEAENDPVLANRLKTAIDNMGINLRTKDSDEIIKDFVDKYKKPGPEENQDSAEDSVKNSQAKNEEPS